MLCTKLNVKRMTVCIDVHGKGDRSYENYLTQKCITRDILTRKIGECVYTIGVPFVQSFPCA